MNKKYLYEYGFDINSQNGEDGINLFLLESLGITGGLCLEIGAWDGFYLSNTANIWSQNLNYNVILIEALDRLDKNKLESVYTNVDCYVTTVNDTNTLEDIILKSKFCPRDNNFILASIDVDENDLNVTKGLGKFKPIILIVEPNGNIIERTNPEGHTVLDIVNLAESMGYTLLGMSGYPEKHSGNVYLIRNDYASLFEITNNPWEMRGILCPGGKPFTK